MSNIGFGYGSEWHLLRYLGRHRARLNEAVAGITGATSVEWLDFPFSDLKDPKYQDREFVGLEHLSNNPEVQRHWAMFWPQRGNTQNWDAIAQIDGPAGREWLLVEAKARVGESENSCGAGELSLIKIDQAFDATRRSVGAGQVSSAAWRGPYYQYANRLAVLHFLTHECNPPVPTRLLYIYFCADTQGGVEGPADETTWEPFVRQMRNTLGIDPQAPLMQRVHNLYLQVNPDGKRRKFPLEGRA